jgi:hypothetical protein
LQQLQPLLIPLYLELRRPSQDFLEIVSLLKYIFSCSFAGQIILYGGGGRGLLSVHRGSKGGLRVRSRETAKNRTLTSYLIVQFNKKVITVIMHLSNFLMKTQ